MRLRVEEGHVLAFSRAVGEPSAPGPSEVVPPTFLACAVARDPEHMLGMRPVGAAARAAAEGSEVLHAEQHFEYLAPVRVGDVLTIEESVGREWTKERRAGGLLHFTEFVREFRDPLGAIVMRSTMVTVQTAVVEALR